MSKAGAWSYSRMKGFETCPKQYYHTHVLKEFPFEETEATIYGNEFHKAAELFVRDGTPISPKFSFAEPLLTVLRDRPGEKHCELKMGITDDLQPCGFFANNVWFRGIVDLAIVDGERAHIIDYKTGKSARYADTKQLELMALSIFAHFPEVKQVKAGLAFVIADSFIPAEYAASASGILWRDWVRKYSVLETAHETNVWNPKPSGLCHKHCPVLECPHNGKNA